jgi:hypothetical protein
MSGANCPWSIGARPERRFESNLKNSPVTVLSATSRPSGHVGNDVSDELGHNPRTL